MPPVQRGRGAFLQDWLAVGVVSGRTMQTPSAPLPRSGRLALLRALQAALLCCAPLACAAPAPRPPLDATHAHKEAPAMQTSTGTFEVKLAPLPADATRPGAFPRMSIDKLFAGDLAGTGTGEMTASSPSPGGVAAYVALERFAGTLHGRRGELLFTHVGTMRPGEQQLSVQVVPGSATGELEGLSGTLTIRIEGGKHFYSFEHTPLR
jgi:Protein of unknown function (DUF3224)